MSTRSNAELARDMYRQDTGPTSTAGFLEAMRGVPGQPGAMDLLGMTADQVEAELRDQIGPLFTGTGLEAKASEWIPLHVGARVREHLRAQSGQTAPDPDAQVTRARRVAAGVKELRDFYGDQKFAALSAHTRAFLERHPTLSKFLEVGGLRDEPAIVRGLFDHVLRESHGAALEPPVKAGS